MPLQRSDQQPADPIPTDPLQRNGLADRRRSACAALHSSLLSSPRPRVTCRSYNEAAEAGTPTVRVAATDGSGRLQQRPS